jgi:hypothetical protein
MVRGDRPEAFEELLFGPVLEQAYRRSGSDVP